MRIVRPEGKEETVWQKAGWSRAPRNGYEWKLLKAGKPEPGTKPTSRRKCKRHGWQIYKCDLHWDKRKRAYYERFWCPVCKREVNSRSRQDPERMKKWRKNYNKRLTDERPDFHDGLAYVSMAWVVRHQRLIATYAAEGKILVVESMGEPVYEIRAVSKT